MTISVARRFIQALPLLAMLFPAITGLTAQSDTVVTLYPDLLSCKPHYLIAGHPGFLHPESRINGGDYRDSLCRFTLAAIDYDGDGVFNQPGVDRLALTIYQDRILRINNGYGTVQTTLGEAEPVLFIDSVGFEVTAISDDGRSVRLRRADPSLIAKADLKIETWLPAISVESFVSKKLDLGQYLHKGKSVYLYFFNSRPLDYQLKKLDLIYAKYAGEVTVIGMYMPFSEAIDQPVGDDFLLRMAKPWPQGICDLDLYKRLQQDMSYYRGVWADPDGRIREINISPKELLEKLESIFGVR